MEFASACGSADHCEEILDWFKDMKENVDQSTPGEDRQKAFEKQLFPLVERMVLACGSTMHDAATASGSQPDSPEPTQLVSETDDDADVAGFSVVSPPAKRMKQTSKHTNATVSNDSAEEQNNR